MNRIYQGKVTKVEILKGKDGKAEPLPDWQDALWQHHQLFQDAVNYYIVCLLALATDPTSETAKLRERITKESEEVYVWGRFRRRGIWRRGLRDSVAPYLTPGNQEPTFEQVSAAVLAGNSLALTDDGRVTLHAGLRQLLSKCTGSSGCRNAAPQYLPRYCDPTTKCSYEEDAASVTRNADTQMLPFLIHDDSVSAQSAQLGVLHVGAIAWPDGRKGEFQGEDAKSRLNQMLARWREKQPESEADWERLAKKVKDLPDNITLPSYAATAAKSSPVLARNKMLRLYAMYFFCHLERSEFTLGLLRASTPKPAPDEKPPETLTSGPGVGDPIRRARGVRGYVFRVFTSLPRWGGDESGQSKWLPFDVAAFEEALKALHQVDARGEERRDELAEKLQQYAYQHGLVKKWKAKQAGGKGEKESERQRPPILAGDPRIERLETLLNSDLATEYTLSEGEIRGYGLQERTIRGFRDLRKKWRVIVDPEEGEPLAYSEATRKHLLEKLRDYQRENPQIVGSIRLYEALLDEQNWCIWRKTDARQLVEWKQEKQLPTDGDFAADPVQALSEAYEVAGDLERLAPGITAKAKECKTVEELLAVGKLLIQPIRLTPADPEHSRRQFYFSDVTELSKKGRLRHDQHFLDAEIACEENDKWQRRWTRIHFAAPRLLRDQLITDGEPKRDSQWQQAMMEALGLKMGLTKKGKVADFADCTAVALMPDVAASGELRILLNFPLTLETEEIARQVGKAARWDPNQFGPNFKNSSWLRWPSTPDKNARSRPWWESGEPFRCLTVDLGQRDAGAFALLEVTPGKAPKPQSRKLGEDGSKTWWATVGSTGLIRLPGEDAMVLRDGKWQEELSGERGRLATREEWDEAQDICTKLDLDPAQILGDDPKRYSFPELNHELLYALRRAQSRLARLQSWSCIATDQKRRKRITEEINEAENGPLELKPLVTKQAWNFIATKLITQLEKDRAAIQRELVRIADRIQPLRGRRWEWVKRDDGSGCYFLRQTNPGTDSRPKLLAGQRGLSIERIEQLESLRQRCQSLNRALMQTPGQPAKLGRSKRGIELPDPCPELLDRLDNLKEQRVNQTAHLILAQALGVRLHPHTNDTHTRQQRDIHGEYEKFREPVDFLVLENLDRYLASQGRSRNENSRLMKWCHRQILGKLKQLCEPYGLRVLETPAAYSSRFCSLSGVAGFRAMELTPDNRTDFRWRKHLDRLADPERAKKLSRDEREESQQVKSLFDALECLNADLLANRPARPKWRTLLAPVAGGPLFVPMCGKVQQADINAAINLGLRAISAPETGDIHVRIRSERKGEKFFIRAENLREKARWGTTPPEISIPEGKSRKELQAEAHPNFFADIGHIARYDRAEITSQSGFASGRGLWGTINQKDWLRVNTLNNDRLEKAEVGRPLREEDVLP